VKEKMREAGALKRENGSGERWEEGKGPFQAFPARFISLFPTSARFYPARL